MDSALEAQVIFLNFNLFEFSAAILEKSLLYVRGDTVQVFSEAFSVVKVQLGV